MRLALVLPTHVEPPTMNTATTPWSGLRNVRWQTFAWGLLVLLGGFCWGTRSGAQLIIHTELGEAEEAFFEGDFEFARFRIDNALAWIEANKPHLIQLGIDHQLLESKCYGLKAQIYSALGDWPYSHGLIRKAERRLEDRRSYYIRRGVHSELFWLYEAFLEFTRGDVAYDECRLTSTALNVPPDLLPQSLQKKENQRRSDLMKCVRFYKEAEKIMEHLGKGGGTAVGVEANVAGAGVNNPAGGPRSDDGGRLDDDDHRQRFAARLCIAMGRTMRIRAQQSEVDDRRDLLRQAASYYDRADQRFRSRKSWKRVINPQTKIPISLADFQIAKDANKHLDEETINTLKAEYIRTLLDWAYYKCDLAELAAEQAPYEEDVEACDEKLDVAKENYDSMMDLAETGLPKGHPFLTFARLSKTRFEALRAAAYAKQAERLSETDEEEAQRKRKAANALHEGAIQGLRDLRTDIKNGLLPTGHPYNYALLALTMEILCMPRLDNPNPSLDPKVRDEVADLAYEFENLREKQRDSKDK